MIEVSTDDKHTVDMAAARIGSEFENLGRLREAFLIEEQAALVRLKQSQEHLRSIVEMLAAKYVTGPGDYAFDLQTGTFRMKKE